MSVNFKRTPPLMQDLGLRAIAAAKMRPAPRCCWVLRFSPERSRWVQSERWHREQQTEVLADGSYRLRVPYADERELLMDILRHGRHVEVEAPASLRQAVADEVSAMTGMYHGCYLINS